MALKGSCRCRNIELEWQTVDLSLVPRACQCPFCKDHNASYVSKSGTPVKVSVRKPNLHRNTRHGSEQATFHSCDNCGDLVLVTVVVTVDGTAVTYGALNANVVHNPKGFSPARLADYSLDTPATKAQRWQDNWCYPITFASAGQPMQPL
ncbi:MAG: hypothetical protein AB8C02_00285 [Halioglobus sp.]